MYSFSCWVLYQLMFSMLTNDIYLRVLLLIAKKKITANWKSGSLESPTVTEWKQRLKQIYMMEKMTASLQLKSDLFNQRWHMVKEYLNL